MEQVAERRDHLDARALAQLFGESGEILAGDLPGMQRRLPDDLVRSALGQELSIGDIGEAMAALRLVHVVRADEHRDALGGERVELVPELAPRLRVHACGRLVEQQQLGVVQQAGGEREPLLPPAGERAGELLRPRAQTEPFEPLAHAALPVGHPVHARDEVEVLLDRQVLVVAEALGHVADAPLDLGGAGAQVEAEGGAAAFVGREQPAQHADRGGLAAAVRPEKSDDPAARDGEVDVIDHGAPAVALGQAVDLDCRGGVVHFNVTSTGCPGWSLGASAALGRASTRKTSFSRRSRL